MRIIRQFISPKAQKTNLYFEKNCYICTIMRFNEYGKRNHTEQLR